MDLGLSFFLLSLGLGLLWKTGGWSVSNAVRFAVVYKIENFAVGFFIFAVATGIPEITSAIVSSAKKIPELSASNLIGSTFVNTCLQVGLAALVAYKLPIEVFLRKRLKATCLAISAIMIILVFDPQNRIYLGFGLVAVYIFSLIWMFKENTNRFAEEVKREEKGTNGIFSPKIDVAIKLAASLFLLMLSAWLSVTSAVWIAQGLNVPLPLIGATVVAVGTALPEMTLEVHAVLRKEYGLALGDIFGSSLLNIGFLLGMLILFNPYFDLSIARTVFPFFSINIVWVFYRLFRKHAFTLYDGIFFIVLFASYIGRIIASQ